MEEGGEECSRSRVTGWVLGSVGALHSIKVDGVDGIAESDGKSCHERVGDRSHVVLIGLPLAKFKTQIDSYASTQILCLVAHCIIMSNKWNMETVDGE